jgi:hypothetical protein
MGKLQTHTGLVFDLRNPTCEMICLEDIAHALSLTCRYGGHCREFYSVAQHSVLCAQQSIQDSQPIGISRWVLMHDASEAYVTDLPRGLKNLLPEYKVLEDRIHLVISKRFAMSWPMPKEIKEYDNRVLITERDALLDHVTEAWDPWSQIEPYANLAILPEPAEVAKAHFLEMCTKLNVDLTASP